MRVRYFAAGILTAVLALEGGRMVAQSVQDRQVNPRTVTADQQCLHRPNESATERDRREYTIQVAAEINQLQAARIAAQPARGYARPSQLQLPQMPDDSGFTFFMDARRYMFTLQDDKDPCNFAVFSGHNELIYAGMPQVFPVNGTSRPN